MAYYVPIPENRAEAQAIVERFRPFFEKESILKIAHNLKYDYKVLLNYGIEVTGNLFDTMIAHYLLNPDGRHGMDYLSEMYLNYKPIALETLIGKKGKGQKHYEKLTYQHKHNTPQKMLILPFNCTKFFRLN